MPRDKTLLGKVIRLFKGKKVRREAKLPKGK
jgi:hypothetical protein